MIHSLRIVERYFVPLGVYAYHLESRAVKGVWRKRAVWEPVTYCYHPMVSRKLSEAVQWSQALNIPMYRELANGYLTPMIINPSAFSESAALRSSLTALVQFIEAKLPPADMSPEVVEIVKRYQNQAS